MIRSGVIPKTLIRLVDGAGNLWEYEAERVEIMEGFEQGEVVINAERVTLTTFRACDVLTAGQVRRCGSCEGIVPRLPVGSLRIPAASLHCPTCGAAT